MLPPPVEVRFQHPRLPDAERIEHYFETSRKAGWYSNFGPAERAFTERASAELLGGSPACTSVNATVALMLALRACAGPPRPGRDVVVVPSFTFVATLAAVTWAGFRPLFVDVSADDWQVPVSELERARADEPAVACLLLTATFGTPWSARLSEEVERFVRRADLPVVLDAAAGLGSCAPLQSPRSATVFSLHATKPFAVGEGALIASHDVDVVEHVRRLSNFGFGPGHSLDGEVGLNGKLSEIQAATALAVLDDFSQTLARRRSAAVGLLERLSGAGVATQAEHERSTFQFVPILCRDGDHRSRIAKAAAEAGVEVRSYFDPPMHQLPSLRAHASTDLGVTEELSARMLCLPMFDGFGERETDLVARAVLHG